MANVILSHSLVSVSSPVDFSSHISHISHFLSDIFSQAFSHMQSHMLAVSTVTLASKPMEFPSIDEFMPPEIIFAGTPFAINRIVLIRLIATAILLLVLCITAARAKVIPGRWQSFVEYGLDFVRTSLVYEIMGEKRGKKYVPLITTIFFSIFFFNLCEIIPGFDIAATATFAMPLMFALGSLVSYWSAGIRTRGFFGFLREELFPKGIMWPIYILLAPINLLEIMIIRPFSLAVRLFANMVAGYLLLALCFAATQFFFVDVANKWWAPLGIITFGASFLMTLFEILVSALQAFIFAILTSSYINMAMPDEIEPTSMRQKAVEEMRNTPTTATTIARAATPERAQTTEK